MRKITIVSYVLCLSIFGLSLLMSCGGDDPVKPAEADRLGTPNSVYFTGSMGSSVLDGDPVVTLTDSKGNLYSGRWIQLELLEGDGALSADSIQTDAQGQIIIGYTFDGSLGSAIIRASYSNFNPVDFLFRASIITPGTDGQGHITLLTDSQTEVSAFLGNPATTVADQDRWLVSASYSSAPGVSVVFDDADRNEMVSTGEQVVSVDMMSGYTGTTVDSIGIGSTIDQLRSAYGAPDSLMADSDNPSNVYIKYTPRLLTFIATDNADTTVVEIRISEDLSPIDRKEPSAIVAPNGTVYHGTMGSAVIDNPLTFILTDASSRRFPNRWVHYSLLSGDGSLSADSTFTNAQGEAIVQLTFDGALGYATLQVSYTGSGTISTDVSIRASMLKLDPDGQGQYVRLNDGYGDVRAFNGQPASVDVDPGAWITYANYETALGVVVIIFDENQDELASDEEEVLGVIVNSIYTGKTADSIGIGSSIADLRAVYGAPDTVRLDPTPPAAVFIRYMSLGLDCYAGFDTDTTIFEIHIVATGSPAPGIGTSKASLKSRPSDSADITKTYRYPQF